ncbi:hypothetical protein CEXT_426531 [Caerostris extrusa]|uniref:Uncharacterized protein n=1 Tax=Caerostris extrusa TaxID=172846 RepID=A0AAV4Y5G4_CAEEX|nr:hypothetical protein CEXT_426531 [Caerostris extrusa]
MRARLLTETPDHSSDSVECLGGLCHHEEAHIEQVCGSPGELCFQRALGEDRRSCRARALVPRPGEAERAICRRTQSARGKKKGAADISRCFVFVFTPPVFLFVPCVRVGDAPGRATAAPRGFAGRRVAMIRRREDAPAANPSDSGGQEKLHGEGEI